MPSHMSNNDLAILLNLTAEVREVLLKVEKQAKSNQADQNTIKALISYVYTLKKISHEKYPFGEFPKGGWPS